MNGRGLIHSRSRAVSLWDFGRNHVWICLFMSLSESLFGCLISRVNAQYTRGTDVCLNYSVLCCPLMTRALGHDWHICQQERRSLMSQYVKSGGIFRRITLEAQSECFWRRCVNTTRSFFFFTLSIVLSSYLHYNISESLSVIRCNGDKRFL
jgi:hypothetical protein